MFPEDRQQQGAILPSPSRPIVSLDQPERWARPYGICSRQRESAAGESLISALGIKTTGPEQNVGDLSGGNQQKVVIAKWLARSPRVLILDEPTKGIDVGAKSAVHAVTRARLLNEVMRS